MSKKHLSHCIYPINAPPFEAFHDGSWHGVKQLKIKNGCVTMQFEHHGLGVREKIMTGELRMRSRKASASDCKSLKLGMDICVFSDYESVTSSSEENLQPAWHDAKIISIERKPHEYRCTCKFSVCLYRNEGPLRRRKRTIENNVCEVAIENIAILQKLNKKPEGDGIYHWDSSEDCSSLNKSKLFLGAFLSEVSWLIVISISNGIDLHIRSIGNKIVYLTLNGDQDTDSEDLFSPLPDNVKAINFEKNNGKLLPKIESFVPMVSNAIIVAPSIIEVDTIHDMFGLVELRRSKRQTAPPDRFVGYDFLNGKRHSVKSSEVQLFRGDELSFRADDVSGYMLPSTEQNEGEQISEDEFDQKLSLYLDSVHQKNSILAGGSACPCLLVKNNEMVRSTLKRKLDDGRFCGEDPGFTHLHKRNKKHHWVDDDFVNVTQQMYSKNCSNSSILTPKSSSCSSPTQSECLPLMVVPCPEELHHNIVQKTCVKESFYSSNHHFCGHRHGVSESRLKKKHSLVKLKSGQGSSLDKLDQKSLHKKFGCRKLSFLNRLKLKCLEKKLQKGNGCSKSNKIRSSYSFSERKFENEQKCYRKKFFSSCDYKQMVEMCMKNIKYEMGKQKPLVVSQWEAKQAVNKSNPVWEFNWKSVADDHVEITEHEDMWNDMENALVAIELTASKEASVGLSGATTKGSEKDGSQACQHEYKMDEEIGIICLLCNIVITELRYILPPFLRNDGWVRSEEHCSGDKLEKTGVYDFDLDPFEKAISSKELSMVQQYNSVWSLIPKLEPKLHDHQKKAFEFLWKNIAGSMNPQEMELLSEEWGGCVISHSPGSGKTLLVISFLESYLSLFPQSRPLVLAPKTALYAWYQEFDKWGVSFPIFQIHTIRNYRREMQEGRIGEYARDFKRDETVLHFRDCLEKFQKWHEIPSVLLMSYPSFFSMTRKDSKLHHRRYMARALRNSPGILILDEGHNPRSTRSKLRKVLMEVKTDLRILLSGTLFQNNFEEYFNTLCLARPRFMCEVANALSDRKRKQMGKKAMGKRRERLARKYFIEKIVKGINSTAEEERERGLEMLTKITCGFIDVYSGHASYKLPGLRCYTLLMKPTDVQQEILSKLQIPRMYGRHPLEIDLMITVASIHPWLVKTVAGVGKFFNADELEKLDAYKFDFRKGTKSKFVVDLVCQCIMKKEKVLIFCRNIAPMKLFIEILNIVFGWKKGREVLVLHGEQDMIERTRVMDMFKDDDGTSQILLASTAACAEGISLTAASRVVMLDLEWNPSKTKQAIARAFRPGQEKMVYVYRLLASGTIEEEKYGRNELKERQSRMIFSGGCVQDSLSKQTVNIDDDVLREIVEDQAKAFDMILKQEKVGNNGENDNEEL